MTRDSAAVAALDDRRRCPISAASNIVDDASTLITNSIITNGSSSNGDVGGVDGGSSPKSSSAVSTTTSCCGGSSSSSSRSGSDDDDSTAVGRMSTVIDDSCPTIMKTPLLPSLHNELDNNIADKDSSTSSNSADTTTTTSIGGRLTFYKDGKFIFQLAAHHQQHAYNNQSAKSSTCRWIPVPTVIQQHNNNVKSIGEWSQHHQNKTIWPYLVTNPASDCKSPQSIQQSQPAIVKVSERKQQQYKNRTTPPPLTSINSAVNAVNLIPAVVVATTTNIVRRPPRKCSTTTSAENTFDLQYNQYRQPESQLRPLSRRSQPYQHQSFMMVATKAIKAQRRIFSLPKKQRRRGRRTTISAESLLQEQQQPLINLECIVRNLWCRRHTSDLLLRRQLQSINNNSVDVVSTVVDAIPAVSQNFVVANDTHSNTGGGKRRSAFSTSATGITVPVTTMTTSTVNIISSGNSSSSPHKKYRFGQQRRVDDNINKGILQPSGVSTNDHSITAILSGGVAGTKRVGGDNSATALDQESCGITSTIITTSSVVTTPQKHQSPFCAPLSLLRTLLKSPSGESGSSPPIIASCNGARFKHHTSSSRKRSAVESTNIPLITPSIISTSIDALPVDNNGSKVKTITLPPITTDTGSVNGVTNALTALHQLPSIHHQSSISAAAAAASAAAAGYFNVLYHQAAMAAAMAYQTNTQLPQPLPKPQPPNLLSSQYPTADSANNSWQRQLNRRSLLHAPKAVGGGSGVTITPSTLTASTIVAPYSSPIVTAAINGSGLLPPTTPSPPPPLLYPHPVHPNHHILLRHQQQQQQYQPVPTVQQPSYRQFKSRQRSHNVSKRTVVTLGTAEFGGGIETNNMTTADENYSSADCMPLNLSKDSVANKVDGTSTAAAPVR